MRSTRLPIARVVQGRSRESTPRSSPFHGGDPLSVLPARRFHRQRACCEAIRHDIHSIPRRRGIGIRIPPDIPREPYRNAALSLLWSGSMPSEPPSPSTSIADHPAGLSCSSSLCSTTGSSGILRPCPPRRCMLANHCRFSDRSAPENPPSVLWHSHRERVGQCSPQRLREQRLDWTGSDSPSGRLPVASRVWA